MASAEQKLARPPSEDEVASQLGQTIETYRSWRADACSFNVQSIEELKTSPSLKVGSGELKALLNVAISKLPGAEKSVLRMYCYEELKSCEIAEILGVSEGRISQIKSQAISRLCTPASVN
jgi:RNA polymerase sigma factor for flagellar operon FliA